MVRLLVAWLPLLLASGALAQTPPAPQAPLQFVPYTDPVENAFSVQVPKGWQTVGGLVRTNVIGASGWVRILSPTRMTAIMIGDPGIAFFTAPINPSAPPPARPGQVFRPYLAGGDFARDYVARVMPTLCSNVVVTGQHVRPDLLQGPFARSSRWVQFSAGDAAFTCTLRGSEVRGLAAAVTFTYPPSPAIGGSLWTVPLLAAYITPPEHFDGVGQLTGYIVSTWRQNPDWLRREQAKVDAATVALNGITQAMVDYNKAVLAQSQAQMHALRQQSEAFDRQLTGSSPFADASGTIYHLDNSRTQWLGPGGRIVGTTGVQPGPGWTRLHEVPPD